MGLVVGTGLGGKIMKYNRKYTIIALTLAGMVACGLSLVPNMSILFIGRSIFGIVCGIILNLTPKML